MGAPFVFYLNFGWGDSKDVWYNIPDLGGFSYRWTKVEGFIVNIIPATAPIAVHKPDCPQPLEVYPNPASEVLCLRGLFGEVVDYTIYKTMGQKVVAGSTHGTIPVAELGRGVYLLHIRGGNNNETVKFVVK